MRHQGRFADRAEAGRELANVLIARGLDDPVVIGCRAAGCR